MRTCDGRVNSSACQNLLQCAPGAHRKAEHVYEVRQPRVGRAHKVVSAVQELNVQQELQCACTVKRLLLSSAAALKRG